MKYLKSYRLFESQGWSLEEIIRMAEAGLMTGQEKAAAMRTAIRQILTDGGNLDPWSNRGQTLLSELPVIAAVGTPEAEAFRAAGWRPFSTIAQIANGTLVWSRLPNDPDSQRLEQIIFYEETGYVRSSVGDRLQVILKKSAGGGLAFFRDSMQEVNERWAIEAYLVPSRKHFAQQQAKAAIMAEIREFLESKFTSNNPRHERVLNEYLTLLAQSGSAKQLISRFTIIKTKFPNLPLWIATDYTYYLRDLFRLINKTGLPEPIKLYLPVPVKIPSYLQSDLISEWNRLRSSDLINTTITKDIIQL